MSPLPCHKTLDVSVRQTVDGLSGILWVPLSSQLQLILSEHGSEVCDLLVTFAPEIQMLTYPALSPCLQSQLLNCKRWCQHKLKIKNKHTKVGVQSESIARRMLALHAVNLGLIPGTP